MEAIYIAYLYLFKVNHGDKITMGEICSKLTIKIPEQYHWWSNWRQWFHDVKYYIHINVSSQLTFTFLKSAMETLEQGVKNVQS